MILRWLFSRTVRRATNFSRHVQKGLNAQRDLLSQHAIDSVNRAIFELRTTIDSGPDRQSLLDGMARLEKTATRWLKPYPHPSLRENVEVVLVAVSVALAIRTFFLQPFKIPTGSMQPTLYGIVIEDLRDRPDAELPGGLRRLYESWVEGISYCHRTAKTDGMLEAFEPPRQIFPFIHRQKLKVGGEWYTVWSSVDNLLRRAGIEPEHLYRRGEDIIRLRIRSGDHLFVDRLTYNFRPPRRGEIIVFETRGILDPQGQPAMPQDQFYVKRLVALGGESVAIGNDRHLRINGALLDASTPHFENVYGFKPGQPPKDSEYSGHLNGHVASQSTPARPSQIAPLFPDEQTAFRVRPRHFLVMGDNTMNSYDGRAWGDFSQTNVIGKHFFVYWPISERFGWAAH
jgi:signal peptidase I